jgi:hypothetical protein
VAGSDSDDLCERLERMKKLCDELEAAQGNVRRLHELIERMRAEADLFRQQLATHDQESSH